MSAIPPIAPELLLWGDLTRSAMSRHQPRASVNSAGPHVRLTCADGTPFPEPLRAVLRRAAWDFGSAVVVISGYRSLAYNRAIYGNRLKSKGHYVGDASQHIRCRAADIRIPGVSLARLHAWALHHPEVGGVGRYSSNFIHIDIRPRLRGRIITWDWRGGRKFARRHHQQQHAKGLRMIQIALASGLVLTLVAVLLDCCAAEGSSFSATTGLARPHRFSRRASRWWHQKANMATGRAYQAAHSPERPSVATAQGHVAFMAAGNARYQPQPGGVLGGRCRLL
jgi:hypothetical protein